MHDSYTETSCLFKFDHVLMTSHILCRLVITSYRTSPGTKKVVPTRPGRDSVHVDAGADVHNVTKTCLFGRSSLMHFLGLS